MKGREKNREVKIMKRRMRKEDGKGITRRRKRRGRKKKIKEKEK